MQQSVREHLWIPFIPRTSSVVGFLCSILNSIIPAAEFDKMQLFEAASEPAPASPHNVPLKLLFVQSSIQQPKLTEAHGLDG